MAKNQHVLQRLIGIQQQLIGAHAAGRSLSSASKGTERETFINSFLKAVFPTPFRFGTGDVTDAEGERSGQLDVVIEYPIGPSLPSVGNTETRLYLAETVAAVVEVKSDVSSQWDEAVSTARRLHPLVRNYETMMSMGNVPERIPLFVVGYTGWKDIETLKRRIQETPKISGILVIDPGLFVGAPKLNGVSATGPWCLWGLITCVNDAIQGLKAASWSPGAYAADLL